LTFKNFVTEIKNQFNKKIKRFGSDRGTKYNSHTFNESYKKHKIFHKTTSPYSPKLNGKVERENRTFIDSIHAICLILELHFIGGVNCINYFLCAK